MPEIHEVVSIKTPPGRVWRAVHEDLEEVTRWAAYLRSARSLAGVPGPGWRVCYELELPGGFRTNLVLQYTAWQPARWAAGRFADGPLEGTWSYSYAAVGGGTRLDYEMKYELRGLLRFTGGLLRGQYEDGIRRGMAMLKEHLEK